MTVSEIRSRYLAFFRERGHVVIPSASLVPENDPTTLFTGSGMQPLLPYLLGQPHPAGRRLVNSQKSFRAMDIEEVGDNRHTTFFEMLGNWSLGDYFKQEQLPWFFEFLTDPDAGVGLNPARLYVTVFAGDEKTGVPRDTESVAIWKRLFREKGIEAQDVELLTEELGGERGMQGGRIFYYDAKKNWWSRAGVPERMPTGEPGGPDSEVFYEFTQVEHDTKFGKHCHPNCDCGRFMEIGNSVFMEYIKQADGTFKPLPQRNVDFGGGLERIAAAKNENPDVFAIDVFEQFFDSVGQDTTLVYKEITHAQRRALRVVVDHLRAAAFLISDGITPSNSDRGYILRRLLRRAIRYSSLLGLPSFSLERYVSFIECQYADDPYTESYFTEGGAKGDPSSTIHEEEARFRKTLESGLREFTRLAKYGSLSADQAFVLFSTYGFPFEMTEELAKEQGIALDRDEFQKAMQRHQALSRAGAEQKFKGGLADTSEMSVKYHTATHLLHQALRDVLGPDVFQKGSNITPERLRFDFSFPRKMTDEEKERVEAIVNRQISASLPVSYEDIPLAEAHKRGAIGLFEENYGDTVRVYTVGNYSLEFCGGPHVTNTSVLGEGGKRFKIQKEEAVSAGVRRIKAVLV